ncbi:MAG: M23 family metallopeptidase [Magnetococcales bacterium]|nr:M23 family metallopeptidase [Magnetococcales bacterium]
MSGSAGLKTLSDLSPNLDAVDELFRLFSVKTPTYSAADPSFRQAIDSLIMSYVIPKEEDERLFVAKFLQDIPSGYPVPFKGVTSPFGVRVHPVHGSRLPHNGVDLRAPLGTPVVSTADGVVEFAGVRRKNDPSGRLIIIHHNHGFKTSFGHLKKILVKKGDFVKKGDTIGLSGQSGVVDGPHLHYGVRYLLKAKNPAPFMTLSVKNFKGIFQSEQEIQWSHLVDRIKASVQQNQHHPSYQLVEGRSSLNKRTR